MKLPRITTSFTRYSDANLENKAQSIAIAVNSNYNFPDPTPTVSDLLDAINNYGDTLAAAVDGSRTDVALKNEARQTLEELLRELGNYVTLTAHADKTILISSGFDLMKEWEPRPPITAPQNLEISSGINSGDIESKVSGVKVASGYSHEYTPDPLTANSVWVMQLDSRCKHYFSGLEPGKKYWFRVAAIGLRGQKAYTSEVSCIVQ